MEIKVRPAVSSDSAACGKVIAAAVAPYAPRNEFAAEFGEASTCSMVARLLDHPEMYGLVAEADNQIAGTVFLDERSVVRGVGWLAVAEPFRGHGIGRLMMNEVIDRSLTSPGMRTVLDSESSNAIGLMSSLRFEAKEQIALLRGRVKGEPTAGIEVRAVTSDDIEACAALCEQAHGFGRESELRNAIEAGSALAAVRDSRITGYATDLASWHAGHAVAAQEEDLRALIAGAAARSPSLSFLVPKRRESLLNWCLGQGLSVERSMVLMSLGEYQDPACAWLPSGMF